MRAALALLLLGTASACVRSGFDHRDADIAVDHSAPPDSARGTDTRGPSDGRAPDRDTVSRQTLVIAVEGKYASHLQQLAFDPTAPDALAVTKTLPPVRLDGITGTYVRGAARVTGTTVVCGDGSAAAAEMIGLQPPIATVGFSFDHSGASADQAVSNLHGVCVLPSGRFVLGEYSGSSGNSVAEYQLSGTTFRFVRPVYSTILTAGTLTTCVAPSDTELYLVEDDANFDLDGDVVRLVQTGGGWQVTHRFDTSSFATAKYGTAHHTTVYAFVRHSSGALFIFPMRRFSGQVRGLIRCPTPDISAASCVELGALPPDTSNAVTSPDAIQGAAQIPGSDDLLFASNRRIYRWRLGAGTWSTLYDMWAAFSDLKTKSGVTDAVVQMRALVLWRE